ncbi:hypothetical protein AOLI_G00139480 [Acnodon oligacanthus]
MMRLMGEGGAIETLKPSLQVKPRGDPLTHRPQRLRRWSNFGFKLLPAAVSSGQKRAAVSVHSRTQPHLRVRGGSSRLGGSCSAALAAPAAPAGSLPRAVLPQRRSSASARRALPAPPDRPLSFHATTTHKLALRAKGCRLQPIREGLTFSLRQSASCSPRTCPIRASLASRVGQSYPVIMNEFVLFKSRREEIGRRKPRPLFLAAAFRSACEKITETSPCAGAEPFHWSSPYITHQHWPDSHIAHSFRTNAVLSFNRLC